MTQNTSPTWQSRFDEVWEKVAGGTRLSLVQNGKIKELFAQELQQARKGWEDEMREKINKEKTNIGYAEGEDAPDLEMETIALTYESNADAFYAGWNQAIKEVLSLISNDK